MSRPPTHYKTLGIARDTSPEQVRAAYRRLAQKYHPDRYEGQGDSVAIMARINQAYDVLSDPQGRVAYDDSIKPVVSKVSAGATAADIPIHRPWVLLWVVVSFIVLAVGWVALRTLVPKPVQAPMVPIARQAPIDTQTLAPLPAIQPWQPPPPAVRAGLAETDPVMRLVRDGTMPSTARQRSP